MKLISILSIIICCGCVVNAQTDTATVQCYCNNQTVYVRFGYRIGDDTTKTFEFKNTKIDFVKYWDKSIVGSDTIYSKTFHYAPATAIGYIAEGSVLKRFTFPFRFPYSVMQPDDPDTQYYLQRLCTKILNAQIKKP